MFKENGDLISEGELDDILNQLVELVEQNGMGMFSTFKLIDNDELDLGEILVE